MFNIGPVELMVVLVLALLVFGPAKLPELLGSVGQAIREFQRASRELTEVFQETQQEFQSALDLDEQHQAAQTTAAAEYAVPAEEVVAAEPPPVTAHPEEFETAAAMLDPVEPFQAPVEPEPVAELAPVAEAEPASAAEAEPVAAAAEPEPVAAEAKPVAAEAVPVAAAAEPPKPKRSRRKKADEPVAEPPAAEEPSTDEPVAIAEVTTTVTPGITASTPLEQPVANGSAPHVNGTAPKPRRRRAAATAVVAPTEDA